VTVATLRVEFRRFEELVVSLGTPAAAERCSGGDAEAEEPSRNLLGTF